MKRTGVVLRQRSMFNVVPSVFSYEYEVCVTADNSIFTCYSFLWKSENDYQIIVQPGQIMKGSRIKSDESHSSGRETLQHRQ